MIYRNEKICPRCDAPTMKNWSELTDEEKDVLERLRSTPPQKNHRVCTRCWKVEIPDLQTSAC